MTLEVRPGPYIEGEQVTFTCEVPRVKGNVSCSHLWLSFKDNTDYGTVLNNHDNTKHLVVSKSVKVDASMQDLNITCTYVPFHGDTQYGFHTITVVKGERDRTNNYLIFY